MERKFPIQCADFDRLVMDDFEGNRVEVSSISDLSDPCLYTDREYSWLQFDYRVLEKEAFNKLNPLLAEGSNSFLSSGATSTAFLWSGFRSSQENSRKSKRKSKR